MKIISTFALLCMLVGCNNDSDTSDNSSDTTQTEIGGIENVNGNMPDSTTGGGTPTSGNNSGSIDSSYADTANKKN